MNLDKLVKNYSKLVVRNRTGAQQHVQYVNTATGESDSITINAGAKRPIPTAGLIQIPGNDQFELIEPTLFELNEKGIIEFSAPAGSGENFVAGEPDVSPADTADLTPQSERTVAAEAGQPSAAKEAVSRKR